MHRSQHAPLSSSAQAPPCWLLTCGLERAAALSAAIPDPAASAGKGPAPPIPHTLPPTPSHRNPHSTHLGLRHAQHVLKAARPCLLLLPLLLLLLLVPQLAQVQASLEHLQASTTRPAQAASPGQHRKRHQASYARQYRRPCAVIDAVLQRWGCGCPQPPCLKPPCSAAGGQPQGSLLRVQGSKQLAGLPHPQVAGQAGPQLPDHAARNVVCRRAVGLGQQAHLGARLHSVRDHLGDLCAPWFGNTMVHVIM